MPGRTCPRILVADDDGAIRTTFRQALTRAGYEVVEAVDGADALDQLLTVAPDLLLLDVQMPRMSGLEVIGAVRADEAYSSLPIVLVTGLDEGDDRVRGLEAGATDYLTKPVYLAELVARVDAHLRTRLRVGDRVDACLAQRSNVLDVLSRVPASSGVPQIADTVCRELRQVDGIAWSALVELGDDRPAVVGSDGCLEALATGSRLPDEVAQLVIERAGVGPWVEPAGLPGEPGGAVSAAPVFIDDHSWGVLLVGTDTGDALARSLHLSTVIDAAALTAVVLAPRVHAPTDAEQIRHELADVIRTAAFHPVFQPIIDLTSGAVVGYEALTRFDDGMRPDLRFTAGHRVGLGSRLEAATLRKVLDQADRLPDAAWLSINTSPTLISEAETLPRLLDGAAREVVVEITEHDPVDDYTAVRDGLERLGPTVRLSVDDAGAGYASLRHVLALSPSFLKLDRSWVTEIDSDTNRRELVLGLSGFAARTGCTLIAEGIEREEEVVVLQELGVPLGQGFHLGKPQTV